jgi:hypothetical protein
VIWVDVLAVLNIIHRTGKINSTGLMAQDLLGVNKMKRIILILFSTFVLAVFYSASALCEVYRWMDEKGSVHFTDDLSQVPSKYRNSLEKIGISEERGETKTEEEAVPKKRDESYKDRLGRGEEYWKGKVQEWSRRLRTLQGKAENLRGQYNEITEKVNNSRSSVERANLRRQREQVKSEMDQTKTQIEEARSMLEKKIPEEAELFKAKPEWIKQ